MSLNHNYSFKDFTGQDLSGHNPDDFSNSTIKGSCFSQETNDDTMKSILPLGIENVIFENCNLDNVELPPTCTIAGETCHRNTRCMDDGEDWVLGTRKYQDSKRLEILEPVNKKSFIKEGKNITEVNN